eukprot:gene13264-4097_t
MIRRPIGTAVEIIVPVALSAILIVAKIGLKDATSEKCFSTFDSKDVSQISHMYYQSRYLYYPDLGWAQKIVNASGRYRKFFFNRDRQGNKLTSEEAVARLVAESKQYYDGAIIFKDVTSDSIPKRVSYKIRRLPSDYSGTNRIYRQFQSPGPNSYSDYEWQFLPMQWLLDSIIIKLQTNQTQFTSLDRLTQFPYPSYKDDPFIATVQALMPILFVVAFIYTAVCMIREIVREKKERLKEAMKMMGLSNWVHWVSWFVKNFAFLTISCALITIVLKASKVFEYTDGFLLFVFFLAYSFSIIFFCFAISVFCCNVICGMLVGALFWIATYVPYAVIASGTNIYDTMSVSQKAAACLLPNTCLGIGIQVMTNLEAAQIGSQWDNIAMSSSVDENFNLLMVIIMFFAQSLIWWIITWYVEAVFPGEFGVPKPFYFFLTPNYWCKTGMCKQDTGCLDENLEMMVKETNPDVEKESKDCKVGIDIRNLTKVFKGATGKKVAVNGLKLRIYKGQITALLGHNGAGKTTTMSILTGLFTPTSGGAMIAGKDINTQMDEIRESLGLCPQHNVLFDRLTVQEHLEFFIALKGTPSKTAKLKIDEMLNDIKLADKKNARSMTLSGGMKRKLCCAIALIGDPDVVFLDEPTSGMDAYARRATWDLLEKYASNKTIVLTTHFMDEADYLGDRIAIMADGELRCCGSSLYLKKKYGVGYHLTLVKNSDFNEIDTDKIIVDAVPTAKMASNGQSEISYLLEHEHSKKFRDLFEKLEGKKEELGLRSFGISVTTMEEVFLKVGEGSDKAFPDGVVPRSAETTMKGICSDQEKLTGIALSLAQFRAMVTKRFLNSKREKKAFVTQLLLPLVMIIGGLSLNLVTSSTADQPPLVLDLSMLSDPGQTTHAYIANYKEWNQSDTWQTWQNIIGNYFRSVRVSQQDITNDSLKIRTLNTNNSVTYKGKTYQLEDTDKTACCKYGDLVLNAKCKKAVDSKESYESLCGKNDKGFGYSSCKDCINGIQSPYSCPVSVISTDLANPTTFYTEYVLEKSNSKRFFRKYVAGITFENKTWKRQSNRDFEMNVWYSNQALHTLPSVFNAASNIVLRYLKGDESYGIEVTNHPLPLSNKEKQRESAFSGGNIILTIFVTLAATFVAASFIVFIVSEKKSKAKHIQFVSGVNGCIYWVSCFCWDFINYLLPAVAMAICFAAFQNTFVKGNDLYALCLIIFMHGLAALPFTYLVSFIFKSPFVAYAVMSIIGFGICVAMTFAVFICRFEGSSCSSAAPVMHKLFLLIPMYGLSSSVLDISNNANNRELCSKSMAACKRQGTMWQSSSFSTEYPGVGWTYLYFFFECFLYLALVILIEENFFVKRRPKAPPPRLMNQYEDVDVTQEKARVADLAPNGINESAVVIRDLTKIYKSNNVRAVDSVSVGIPYGQCFGLLGVNGAGKTTTFSMLTGETNITGGTAFLNGLDIQAHLRKVQQRIGYCPQFDALINHLTGREMLEMFARLRGIPSYKIPDVVNAVIHDLNLENYSDKMCGTYSGGNKRKLSTAIALVGDPPIIFLDEPTSGMDPVSRRFLWNTLKNILDSSRSIILTSHSMEECEALCDRLVIMVNGEFRCVGGLQHIKSRFGQGYTMMIKIGDKETERRHSFRKTGSTTNRAYNVSVSSNDEAAIINELEQATGNLSAKTDNQTNINQSTERLKSFIARHIKDSHLLDERPGMLEYQILNPDISLSYMFGILEDNAADLGIIDYSLSQTTLEQVFINFAKYQREEAAKKKKLCACCCT